MKQNQVKWGVVLSYILIVINTLYGLFVTPYMIGCLGESEYGVYKTISSLSSALMVIDLGIGGTVMRYVAKFRANKEEKEIPNFVAMNLVQAAAICGVILVVAAGVFQTIEPTYAATFTAAQIQKAQSLFAVLIVNMLLHVFNNVISGVITGSNRFLFGNGLKVARIITRVVLMLVLLRLIPDAMVLVFIDMGCSIFFLLIELIYIRKKLGIKIQLTHWDRRVFLESGKYTILMFLTSVAAQVNNNLDNVVIGAISGPAFVTVYSMGLLIFGMFENLSTAVSGVMLPTVTNLLSEENPWEKVEALVVKAGRLQFMLLGAAFVGFFCLGKDFILLWLGPGFEDVYIITLILMGPALFELCVNVCLAVLRAQNKLGFRTTILFASTVLNMIVTIVAVKYWSYIGAAFGTAASFLIGSIVVMNIYYKKKLGLPMLRIYRKILSRTWLCLLLAGGALFAFSRVVNGSIWSFIAGVAVFGVVYGGTMLLFGFNQEEKSLFKIGGKKNG